MEDEESFERILIDVEHRTKKERQHMSTYENFITEGNEKADELAKEGAMLDEGFMAQARAKTMQQERKEVYAALCSTQPAFTAWWWTGKSVKNSSRSQEKNDFRGQEKRGNKASNGVAQGEILGREFWKMVSGIWEDMIW